MGVVDGEKHIPAGDLTSLVVVVLVGVVSLLVAADFDVFLGGFLVAFVAYALAGLVVSLRLVFDRLLGGFFTAFVAFVA